MPRNFLDGPRGVNRRSVAASNRQKNVCTECRQSKVRCKRDLGALVCGHCLKKGRLCIPATKNGRISNPDYSIPRSHDELRLHNYQGLQSPFPAYAHNPTDLIPQATDHWQQLYLPSPSTQYYFQGDSMPVGTYQQQQGQENEFVNTVTNNFYNTSSSFNYPTWNTGLGTTHTSNFNELPLGYYEFDETQLWFL